MTDPVDIIASIYYINPYASLPPGHSTSGLSVNVEQDSVPAGIQDPVLVIRLRLSNAPEVIGVSATSGPGTSPIYALYQPDFPLAATAAYLVDVIWVPSGTSPNGIDWQEAVATAPVTAATVEVAAADFDGQNVTARLRYGASSFDTGAKVMVYGFSGTWVLAGSAEVEGDAASVSVSGYPAPYRIYATALMPAVSTGGAGGFAAPFSQGPFNAGPLTVPQAAASVVAAAFDGTAVSLGWALATVEGAPDPEASRIGLTGAGGELACYTGGPTSASFVPGAVAASGMSAVVQTTGVGVAAAPLTIPLITAVPTVSNVTIKGANVEADVSTDADASQGWLVQGEEVLVGPVAASGGKVSFTYAATGLVGLAVVTRGESGDGKTTGPTSPPSPLLATAPVLAAATIATDPSDSRKWQIACQWHAVPDAPSAVSGYTVEVFDSGSNTPLASANTTGTTAVLSFDKSGVVAANTQTLHLTATGITGGASPTSSQTLVFATPVLTAVTATADQLAAAWTPPAGLASSPVPAYAIRVLNGAGSGAGETLALGAATTGSVGAVPLADLSVPSGGSAVVAVDVIQGPVRLVADTGGADGQSATAILTAPHPTAASTNPATGLTRLHWSDAGTGLSYALAFSDGSNETSNTTHYHLTSAQSVGAQLSYRVAATQTVQAVAVTGPYGESAMVPTEATNLVATRYDGTALWARWAAHGAADAHVLSIYDDTDTSTAAAQATINGSSGSLAFAADADKSYTVYVQPVGVGGTGLAGNSAPLFAAAYFLSAQPASAAMPYVYPATVQANLGSPTANPPAQAITLYLPQLGLTAGALGTDPIASGPFTLEPSGDDALPYKLKIAADATAWGFDTTAIRTALQSDYTQFLTSLESPGGNLTGASAYGLYLVQEAIARMLPQTFEEQLYYNFGFSLVTANASAYVDLRPGMVLRVVLGDYVSINEQGLPTWLNGYAGASVFDFEIGSYHTNGAWRVGFDGFLNQLASHNALQVAAPFKSMSSSGQSGVAAAADLYYPQFQQPYYRMFVPAALLSPSSTTNANQVNLNFALVAAGSYADIEASSPDPQQYATAYFRGRTSLEAMIRVSVDGVERLVPVGTTLGNLVEPLKRRPASPAGASDGVRLIRAIGPATTSTTAADGLPALLDVMLDWQGFPIYAAGTGYDAFSLPLLAGDRIVTAPSEG